MAHPPALTTPRTGVFDADAFRPPTPPPGAVAVEVWCQGRLVGFSWAIPEHDDDLFRNTAWAYHEAREAVTDRPAPAPRLLLLKP